RLDGPGHRRGRWRRRFFIVPGPTSRHEDRGGKAAEEEAQARWPQWHLAHACRRWQRRTAHGRDDRATGGRLRVLGHADLPRAGPRGGTDAGEGASRVPAPGAMARGSLMPRLAEALQLLVHALAQRFELGESFAFLGHDGGWRPLGELRVAELCPGLGDLAVDARDLAPEPLAFGRDIDLDAQHQTRLADDLHRC